MKRVLIDPITKIYNSDKTSGYRLVDVVDTEFAIAEPFFWVDCEDSIAGVQHMYYYDPEDSTIKPKPVPVEENIDALLEELLLSETPPTV